MEDCGFISLRCSVRVAFVKKATNVEVMAVEEMAPFFLFKTLKTTRQFFGKNS